MQHRVGAGNDWQEQPAVFLRPSRTGGLSRHDHDDFLIALHHPIGKHDGFGFVRIAAGDKDHIGFAPIVVRSAKRVEPGVVDAGSIVSRSRFVVRCVRWRLDRLKSQLGNRVGVFKVLIRERFHSPSGSTVLFQNVLADFGHHFDCQVPRDRLQFAADSHHRFLQTIRSRTVGRIHLFAQATATHAVVAVLIHHAHVRVSNDSDMVFSTIDNAIAMGVGAEPLTGKFVGGEIDAQCVFFGGHSTLCSMRPRVDFVAASDDAVITSGGVNFGIRWWQRNGDVVVLIVFVIGHYLVSAVGFAL